MSDKPSIEERFLDFHARNPEVYMHLVRLAREAKERGRTKLGIKQIWEVCRWFVHLETGSDPKLCNDYHARYSRLIMAQEPDLDGMFELRELRSERVKRPKPTPLEVEHDLNWYVSDFIH